MALTLPSGSCQVLDFLGMNSLVWKEKLGSDLNLYETVFIALSFGVMRTVSSNIVS